MRNGRNRSNATADKTTQMRRYKRDEWYGRGEGNQYKENTKRQNKEADFFHRIVINQVKRGVNCVTLGRKLHNPRDLSPDVVSISPCCRPRQLMRVKVVHKHHYLYPLLTGPSVFLTSGVSFTTRDRTKYTGGGKGALVTALICGKGGQHPYLYPPSKTTLGARLGAGNTSK